MQTSPRPCLLQTVYSWSQGVEQAGAGVAASHIHYDVVYTDEDER